MNALPWALRLVESAVPNLEEEETQPRSPGRLPFSQGMEAGWPRQPLHGLVYDRPTSRGALRKMWIRRQSFATIQQGNVH